MIQSLNDMYEVVTSRQEKTFGFDTIEEILYDNISMFYRKDSIDAMLANRILIDQCYSPSLTFNRNIRGRYHLENVNTIIDVGANIGLASRYFHKMFPYAAIYALEPDRDNFNLLCRNCKAIHEINVFRQAIWNHNNGVCIGNRAKVVGHSGKVNPAKYMVTDEIIDGEDMISSTRFSDFLHIHFINQIDILKIDIQGAEIEMFQDSEEWLPKVRLMFIEIHDLFREGCSNVVLKKIADTNAFLLIGSPDCEIIAFLRKGEVSPQCL